MQSARFIVHLMLSFPARPFCEAVLHLIRLKCIPLILYGLDACPINATNFKSMQHPITIFLKMFATKCDEVGTECQQAIGFSQIAFKLIVGK